MPDVHVPKLEADEEVAEASSTTDAHTATERHKGRSASHRSKSLLKIGLEVVLIATGVFLGLMGEAWREHTQHRELAEESLRRFRTEIPANRDAVLKARDYHVTMKTKLAAFLAASGPKTVDTFDVGFHGLAPVAFERTAWDLAVATGSLTYLDSPLAFALSRLYTAQQGLVDQKQMIVQSTISGRSWTTDFEGNWRSVLYYFSDLDALEPALLHDYDAVLPQIDRALGEAAEN